MSLGSQVKKYREGAALTFAKLTELSGVEVGTINALEKRNSKRSEHAPALAKALGLSLEQLLDVENDYIERVKSHLATNYSPSVAIDINRASENLATPWTYGPWPFRIPRDRIVEYLTPDDLERIEAYIQAIIDTRQGERLKNAS